MDRKKRNEVQGFAVIALGLALIVAGIPATGLTGVALELAGVLVLWLGVARVVRAGGRR